MGGHKLRLETGEVRLRRPGMISVVSRRRSVVVGGVRNRKAVSKGRAFVGMEEGCCQLGISHKVIQELGAVGLTRLEDVGMPSTKHIK